MMNNAPVNSTRQLDPAAAGSNPPDGPKPLVSGWPWRKLIFLIALAFAAHVGLVFFFGRKKPVIPRAVSNVPHLQLADSANALVALGNPTLFALPNPRDFSAAVWLKIPDVAPPSFRWTEPPQWLPLNPQSLGADFRRFMQTNRPPEIRLNLKPPPGMTMPKLEMEPALPQNSTLKIKGALARRGLLSPPPLPSLPDNNVISPSRVQALVDAAGNVISAVLIPDNNSLQVAEHYDLADQRALEIARHLRFGRAAQLTLGEIIFNWHTIPTLSTNPPANP